VGAAGLVARRGYFTLDADLSENWFGRARLELNQSGAFETYTFKSQIKDLYLGWNMGRQRLLLGLSPTPTFDLIESIWDFCYLAGTPMDLQGAPSRDTGISLKGPIDATGTIAYRAMCAAPVDFGADSGDQSKWMGAMTWKPSPKWTLDLYADHQAMPGPTARATSFFGGIEFQASPHFFVTPNTVITRYDRNDQGTRPGTDVYIRLTLFINFE